MIVVTRNHLWLVDSHHKGPGNADVTSLTKIIAWLQKYSWYHLWDHLSGLNLDATANVWFNSDFILLSEFSYIFISGLKTSTTNPCKKQTPSVRRYPHWHLFSSVSFFPVTHTFILFLFFYHVSFFFSIPFSWYFFTSYFFSTTLLLFFLLPFLLVTFFHHTVTFFPVTFFPVTFFRGKIVTFFPVSLSPSRLLPLYPVTFFPVTFFPTQNCYFFSCYLFSCYFLSEHRRRLHPTTSIMGGRA